MLGARGGRARGGLSIAAVAASLACHDFVDLELGVCGNRIVETNEDCDDPDDPACLSCRFSCDPQLPDPGCPSGRLCGSDRICRIPSGRFIPDPIIIDEEGARWIEVGDFDGDLRDDLVLQFDQPDVKMAHVDPSGSVEVLELFEPLAASLAVVDLTGDGLDDLFVLPEPESPAQYSATIVSVWSGTIGRQLQPRYFATLRSSGQGARLLAATPVPDRVLEFIDESTTRAWASDSPVAVDVAPLGLGGSSLGRMMAVANLDGGQCNVMSGASFAEHEVALGPTGGDAVLIGSTCGDEAGIEPRTMVSLPAGVVLSDAGTFWFDVNGDGQLDLLAQEAQGPVRVSYGVGGVQFHSTPVPPSGGADGRFSTDPLWSEVASSGRLLAVDDYDGDGLVELVFDEYYVGAPESCGGASCEQMTWAQPLRIAVTIDINDDGAPDLASLFGDFVTVRLGDPQREVVFEPHQVEMSGEIRHPIVGDFNRDTIQDLAFIEHHDEAPPDADEEITVLYGGNIDSWTVDRFGPFGDVQDLAVDQAATLVARLRDKGGQISGAFIRPEDPWHDFGLSIAQPVPVRLGEYTVIGAPVRRPGESEVLGHFGFLGGSLSPHDILLGDELSLDPVAAALALVVAVDLEQDGQDELVVLGTGGGAGVVWQARFEFESGRWRIDGSLAMESGFARRLARPAVAQAYPPPGGGPGSEVAVGDADGDGDLDLVVTTDRPSPQVWVLRNEGGTLLGEPVGPLDSVDEPEFEFAHIDPWHPDAHGVQRWLVGGSSGVALATIDVDAAQIRFGEQFDIPAEAIAAADVDGDGLIDAVLATEDDVRIFRAEETIGGPVSGG